jgi:hypothetical protein
VNEVFDDFVFSKRNISLEEARDYIEDSVIDDYMLDSVSLFKILLSYITHVRENENKFSKDFYVLPRRLYPQIRYIIESERKEIFESPDANYLQDKILQYLPENNYASMRCTFVQLQRFKPDFAKLSYVEQELTRRLFHVSVANRNVDSIEFLPLDEILPQVEFLHKMRSYVHMNLASGVQSFMDELRRIGDEVYQAEARMLDNYVESAAVHLNERIDESVNVYDDFLNDFGSLSDDELENSSKILLISRRMRP